MKHLPVMLFLCLYLFITGCDKSVDIGKGRTTNTLSSEFLTLEDKVTFFKRYVRLDQSYQKLDFSVVYHDNSIGIPGPSDWDIRLVAIVPPGELEQWVSGIKQFPDQPDTQ